MNGTSHDFNSTYSFSEVTGPRRYDGAQCTGQATLLFQSIIGSTTHGYRAGLSFLYDDYREFLGTGLMYSTETPAEAYAREHRTRQEPVPGAFAEYTYQNSRNLTVVAGLRADRHNLYGWQVTPRFNLKYDATQNSIFQLSAGRGWRVANPIADNAYLLARARTFVIGNNLRPETAWNMGGSFTQYFTLWGRQAAFVADCYHTEFGNQVVADMYTAPQLVFVNNLALGGRSFARSMQAELQVKPFKGLQVKGTYKYLDVRTTYGNELLPKPLTPGHRAFLNLGYASAFDKWRANYTVQWFGRRPVAHLGNDATHQHAAGQSTAVYYAPRYAALTTQITRAFKRLEVYAGVENLTNYRQPNPVESATFPFSPTFDAAMVWGPVYGRLTYAGLRYRIE